MNSGFEFVDFLVPGAVDEDDDWNFDVPLFLLE
jgi:hypothetical protein